MPPLIEELTDAPSPADALAAFAAWPDVILFESVLRWQPLGRYSFLTADPFATSQVNRSSYGTDPFAPVRDVLRHCPANTIAGLPPFQGGAAGILSYELGGCWERLPRAAGDELAIPDAVIGVYDWVLAWDHVLDRTWIISHGFPAVESSARKERAARRINEVQSVLSGSATVPNTDIGTTASARTAVPAGASRIQRFPLPGHPGISSDFTREQYLRTVERVIEYIRAGDIFQANVSQRLLGEWSRPAIELYQSLRRANPATFAGYFTHDDWSVVSSSPERFVRVSDGNVETRPIKGTRRRQTAEADLYTRDELRQSQKDIAENVMIVDLLRNDLSRVCDPGSITVPQLCVVEGYETVQHLVSEIRGTLRPGSEVSAAVRSLSLFPAVFPGGSITGAPKVRAMEIIAEVEPTARGPYCGSLFYCGFDGALDSSILIRTLVVRGGTVQCSAGGGIVAQSDPAAEYEETLHKAAGMLRALSVPVPADGSPTLEGPC